jgi:hypothetical protein
VTAPLTPAECDLRGYEFMPLYGHVLFASDFDGRVSDGAWRAAVTLWWQSWQQVPAASLPNDDTVLCKLAGLGKDVKSFRKIKADALYGYELCDDGRLYHRRLAAWAIEAFERRLKDRERKAKWRDKGKDKDVPETGTGTGNAPGPGSHVPPDKTVKRSEVKRSEATENFKPEVATPSGTAPVDNSGTSLDSGLKKSKVNGNGEHRQVTATWRRNDAQAAEAGKHFGLTRRPNEPLDDFVDRIDHARKYSGQGRKHA